MYLKKKVEKIGKCLEHEYYEDVILFLFLLFGKVYERIYKNENFVCLFSLYMLMEKPEKKIIIISS